MLRRTLPIATRFTPALAPGVYLQLHWSLPATKGGQDLAAMLTGWYVVVCAVLIASANYLPSRRAER